jgi:hypothetical protein
VTTAEDGGSNKQSDDQNRERLEHYERNGCQILRPNDSFEGNRRDKIELRGAAVQTKDVQQKHIAKQK